VRIVGALLPILVMVGCSGSRKPPSPPDLLANHGPRIRALAVHPESIGPLDSSLIVCTATDVDGDTLVYDWNTDGRLRIKGAPSWSTRLNNQLSDSVTVFNANLSNPINDSAWVNCAVRDRRGGGDVRLVHVLLRRQ
jgi:hypothetical protein